MASNWRFKKNQTMNLSNMKKCIAQCFFTFKFVSTKKFIFKKVFSKDFFKDLFWKFFQKKFFWIFFFERFFFWNFFEKVFFLKTFLDAVWQRREKRVFWRTMPACPPPRMTLSLWKLSMDQCSFLTRSGAALDAPSYPWSSRTASGITWTCATSIE